MNELETIQKNAYIALEKIDQLFKENHITYFLIAGTALGAVRNHGFIPWDDDIDIAIFYKDKEKVSYLLQNNLREPFQWVDNRTVQNYPRLFGKVLYNKIGCVDVWPLIKTSDYMIGRNFQWIVNKVLFKVYKAKLSYVHPNEVYGIVNKFERNIAKIISAFISKKTLLKLIRKNEILFAKKKNPQNYVVLYGSHHMREETIRTEWLFPASCVQFEQGRFPSIGNIDAYLTNMYSDYMSPPECNDRGRRHGEKFQTIS